MFYLLHPAVAKMSQVFEVHAVFMVTVVMFNRAAAHVLDVHFTSKISVWYHFKEFGSTSQPQFTCNYTNPEPPQPASSWLSGFMVVSHLDNSCSLFTQPMNFCDKLSHRSLSSSGSLSDCGLTILVVNPR